MLSGRMVSRSPSLKRTIDSTLFVVCDRPQGVRWLPVPSVVLPLQTRWTVVDGPLLIVFAFSGRKPPGGHGYDTFSGLLFLKGRRCLGGENHSCHVFLEILEAWVGSGCLKQSLSDFERALGRVLE